MKCIAKVKNITYRNEESYFTIASFQIIEKIEGPIEIHPIYKTFTLTGVMPYLIEKSEYMISASEVEHKKYGKQYSVNSINLYLREGLETEEGQKKYLQIIFTDNQVKEMCKALDNPYKTLLNKDMQELVKVKGCGLKTAADWVRRFHEHMPMSNAMSELYEYGLTEALLKKIIKHYKSNEIAVEIIKKNPYKLIEVSGIGWKKCDEIALKSGMDKYSPCRIGAYIMYYLDLKANEGFSYVPTDYEEEVKLEIKTKNNQTINLMDNLISFFGEDLPDEAIGETLESIKDKLWFNKDRTQIGLMQYRKLEEQVAKELLRIKHGENKFKYSSWREIIKKKEEEQGWNYAEQQLAGIKAALENQVVAIIGEAGTGKTSAIDGIISILSNYTLAQTALSGRAAARMSEITHKDGYTIHRLLGYPKGDSIHGKYLYNTDNPLKVDIIIVDEISMVDGKLFLRLLQAIPTGAKLIMLGDAGQLECIGSMNIIFDLMHSKHIPSIELTEIHRQAQNSGILTEARKARRNIQLVEKDYVGVDVRGKLKDLTIDCYSDKSNTFYKIMQYVACSMKKINSIIDLMVIVANKASEAGTYNINAAIQELYNPASPEKEEVFIETSHCAWYLREGDKVINVANNYEIKNEFQSGIFNGNMGIIKKIDVKKKSMIIDFIDLPGEINVPSNHWKSIELGYCITCHKAQGSQAQNVIVGLDFGSYIQLSREWIYTALTRAEKSCVLVAQNNALRFAVAQSGISMKQTHLVSLLEEQEKNRFVF